MFRGKQLWFLSTRLAALIPDSLYLKWKFRLLMGYVPDLKNPRSYSEKLQWLKLHDRQPLHTSLVDKAEVKNHVAGIIGAGYVIPTLAVWDRVEDIDWNALPERFVLKCTHDSGSAQICRDKAVFDRNAAEKALSGAMKGNFYLVDREWPYKNVRPRIIAEPLLEGEIRDYKFFCFDGKPELMFIASDRQTPGEETKFDFYDMDFRHLPFTNGHPNAPVIPDCPGHWAEMKKLAAILSAGMKHVRVDFYEVGGQVLFGEYTFFHWSGMKPFDPAEWDYKLGDMISL